MLNLNEDIGWDTQLIPSNSSRGYRKLEKELLTKGLVAHTKGNTYVFLANSNIWSIFISAEAQRQLCDITGSESATVNYLGACEPYFDFLQKRALRTGSLPVSICIGTWRFAISLRDDGGLTLTKCSGIASIENSLDERIQSFCVMPCGFQEIPSSGWSPGGSELLYRYLAVLFPDPVEFDTVRWIIGMAVTDPGYMSKFLLLYGPGGTGKSTLIRAIESILVGCCGVISSSSLTDSRVDMHPNTARAIASKRVVTAGDINLKTNKLNLHTIKEATGHDSLSIPPIKVSTRCTVIAGCNNLPDPREQDDWSTTAISRRAVVVVMNVKSSMLPKVERPDSSMDCQDMLLSCVSLFLRNPSMPASIRTALYTTLGIAFGEVEDKIEITEKVEFQDIFDTNTNLEIHFGLPLHTLGELCSVISMNLVVTHAGIHFIKNIKQIEPFSV